MVCDRSQVTVDHAQAPRRHNRQFVVLEVDDLLGMPDKGGSVAGNVVSPIADADDQGGFPPWRR